MELQGKIIAILETRTGVSQSGKTWASQEAVIEVPGKYPKKMVFTLFGEERIEQAGLFVGMECIVYFDIDAHQYQGRWFNSITAFAIKNTGIFTKEQTQPEPTPAPTTIGNQQTEEQTDDLPF